VLSGSRSLHARPSQSLTDLDLHSDPEFAICTSTPTSIDPHVPHLTDISRSTWDHSYLSRRDARFVLPAVVAPPITLTSTSTTFTNSQISLITHTPAERALFGLAPSQQDDPLALSAAQSTLDLALLSARGLIGESRADQLPQPSMQMPEMKRLIFDSAKLARLDLLLRELKKGGHRVLLYFQMTKMIDLIEEYLVYRQYKYLRLDGNSKISDRRDMVTSWQTESVPPSSFVFFFHGS
jgi:DNA helicase INO80